MNRYEEFKTAEANSGASFPEVGDTFYLVPSPWLSQFKRISDAAGETAVAGRDENCAGDGNVDRDGNLRDEKCEKSEMPVPSGPGAPSSLQRGASGLGAIDCSSLAPFCVKWGPGSRIVQVPRSLREGRDFEIVSAAAFSLLESWFGESEVRIERFAVPSPSESAAAVIETHPPVITFSLRSHVSSGGGPDERTATAAFASRCVTVGEARDQACAALRIAPEQAPAFTLFDPVTGEDLCVHPARTLQEMSIEGVSALVVGRGGIGRDVAPVGSIDVAPDGSFDVAPDVAPVGSFDVAPDGSFDVAPDAAPALAPAPVPRRSAIDSDLHDDTDSDNSDSDAGMAAETTATSHKDGYDGDDGDDCSSGDDLLADRVISSALRHVPGSRSYLGGGGGGGGGGAARGAPMHGLVGLGNLGNTCFMNSGLQCLSNVPVLTDYFLSGSSADDLNTDNPLGCGGRVATEYGNLIEAMWRGYSGSVSPRDFRYVIAKFAPRFTGYNQHDSQEFLSFLLDGLHEDLNRVRNKVPTEAVESDENSVDAEVANKAWETHKVRNDSIIVDRFQGQYKSRVECPDCDRVSVTFDPFMYLTLELPVDLTEPCTVFVHRIGSGPVRARIRVPKIGGTLRDLRRAVVGAFEGLDDRNLAVGIVYKGKFVKFADLSPSTELSGLTIRGDRIHVYELAGPEAPPAPARTTYSSYSYSSIYAPLSGGGGAQMNAYVPMNDGDSDGSDDIEDSDDGSQDAQGKKDGGGGGANIAIYFTSTPRGEQTPSAAAAPRTSYASTYSGYSSYSSVPASSSHMDLIGEPEMIHLAVSNPSEAELCAAVCRAINALITDGDTSSPASLLAPLQLSTTDASLLAGGGDAGGEGDQGRVGEPGPSEPGARGADRTPSTKRGAPEPAAAGTNKGDAGSADTDNRDRGDGDRGDGDHGDGDDGDGDDDDDDDDNDDDNGMADALDAAMESSSPESSQAKKRRTNGPVSAQDIEVHVTDTPNSPQRRGAPLRSGEEAEDVDLPPRAAVVVTVDANIAGRLREALQVVDDASVTAADPAEASHATLDECLEHFTKKETLTEENLWYCNRCKEHRAATKELQLWRLPDVLIVHLKRFLYDEYHRDKIDLRVDFPMKGLDMRRHLGLNPDEDAIYDLVAVSNHMGGCGGGHYTAYALNRFTSKWHSFDDSWVSELKDPETEVTGNEAYVLFYVRRSVLEKQNAESNNAQGSTSEPAAERNHGGGDDDDHTAE